MKKIFFGLACLTIYLTNLKAQNVDSITLSKLKLNFVVPDMPAFKSLGSDPSNLLRASTVQAIAINASQFFQDRKFVIPQAFAMEISPALILNAKKGPKELQQYQKNAVLNSFRISVGSSVDTIASSIGRNLSLGFRISLIDKGDPTTDENFLQSIVAELDKLMPSLDEAQKEFAVSKGYNGNNLDSIDNIVHDHQTEFQLFFESKEDIQGPFQQAVNKLKDDYKREHWNDDKLDIAAAILSSSPDSLLKNIVFNKADFWLTWAIKSGKNSQLFIGVNAEVAKHFIDSTNKSRFNFSIPARYLIGTNRVKGFAEAQFTHTGVFKYNELSFNLGTELNIIDGVWVNIDGGFNYNTTQRKSSLIANFNLKLTLPENFKLF